MISLCAVVGMFLVWGLLLPWVLTVLARAEGSERGRLWVGLGAVVQILLVGMAVEGLGGQVPALAKAPPLLAAVILLLVQLAGAFLVLRWTFGLSARRTLTPFRAYVVIMVALVVLAVGVVRPYVSSRT